MKGQLSVMTSNSFFLSCKPIFILRIPSLIIKFILTFSSTLKESPEILISSVLSLDPQYRRIYISYRSCILKNLTIIISIKVPFFELIPLSAIFQ